MSEASGQRCVVYALTSEGGDPYAAMTRLSLASLRLSNPGVRAVLACDELSHAALRQARDRVLDEADAVVTWATPSGDAQLRSRYLKTTLRQNLAGAFLYLDADTLVRKRLDEVFALATDVAAAPNHSSDDLARQLWTSDTEMLAALGWATSPKHYFNAGIVFLNDTSGARTLAERWHQNWSEACVRLGRSRDQPAFNAALLTVSPQFTVLPHRFNAQFRANPAAAQDAAIWHYYGSTHEPPMSEVHRVAMRLGPRDEIDPSMLRRLVARSQPWLREHAFDDLMIAWVRRKKKLSSFDRLWLQGRRLESLRQRGRNLLGLKKMPEPRT